MDFYSFFFCFVVTQPLDLYSSRSAGFGKSLLIFPSLRRPTQSYSSFRMSPRQFLRYDTPPIFTGSNSVISSVSAD